MRRISAQSSTLRCLGVASLHAFSTVHVMRRISAWGFTRLVPCAFPTWRCLPHGFLHDGTRFALHFCTTVRILWRGTCLGGEPRAQAFRAQGSRSKAQGADLKVQGAGLRVQGSRLKAHSSGLRIQGFGFKVRDARLRAHGKWLRVQGSEPGAQGGRARSSDLGRSRLKAQG